MTTSINTFRTLFVSLSSISVVLLLTMSISRRRHDPQVVAPAVQFPKSRSGVVVHGQRKEGVYARFTDSGGMWI